MDEDVTNCQTGLAMLGRTLLVWLLLLVVAVIAAAFRTKLLEPRLGEPKAHVLGTIAVVAVFALLIWLLIGWITPTLGAANLLVVGGIWLVLTVLFEFAFGRYVMGHPWSRLLADYNILAGRLWVLVLLTILFWPLLAGILKGRSLSP
ncbi:MAG: hypothetical protein PVI01_15430 [Gemmatimonadales bacterium]